MTPARKGMEQDDPYAFVATGFPVEDREAADRETARCLVEDYALMGFAPERILRLFQIPTYAGAHAILQRQGAALIVEILADVFGRPVHAVPLTPAEREGR